MDFQVRITEKAIADFEQILAYSWENFPNSTEQFGNALLAHLDILKKFPYLGSKVRGRRGVRQLVHTPIFVHYRVHENKGLIEILHFWHGARQKPPASEKL